MARASIREDLYAAHAALTADVLSVGQRHARRRSSGSRPGRRRTRRSSAAPRTTLEEIQGSEAFDLANLSVAMRTMRTLLRTHA